MLVGVVTSALLGFFALVPFTAHAAGCEDSWSNTAGGSWFEGANWSTKSPPREGEEACITAAGTYTVTMVQASEGVTVKALTIGGATGKQMLSIGGSCSSSPRLKSVSGISVETNGVLTTTEAGGCTGNVRIAGPLTNKGTLAIDYDTEYGFGAATLLNEGTIDLAGGAQLLSGNETTVANAAGSIESSGTGNLLVQGGTLNQGAGKSSGEPVYVEDGTLDLTGRGAASVTTLGTSTLTGSETLYKGQRLAVKGVCAYGHGNLSRAGALLNEGTIVLESPEVCGLQANLRLGASKLLHKGTLAVESGSHLIEAETGVENEKTFSLAAGAELNVEGPFTETEKATFDYGIGPAGAASLRSFGDSKIAGTLSLQTAKGFVGALGQSYTLLGSPGYLGTFATVTSATIKSKVEPGLYYRPDYSDSLAMVLAVAQATLSVTPGEALPGATVHLLGGGFPAGDSVKLSFKDAKKTQTTFTSATASYNGFVPAEVTIPLTAAAGKGTLTAQDTVTGVKATVTIKVT
jgi:hypothetical protein